MTQNKPMTLRHLCAMLEPEYLDAPLSFVVLDGNLNLEVVPCPDSLWEMPRRSAKPATNEPASLYLNVTLCRTRLVRRPPAIRMGAAPKRPVAFRAKNELGVWIYYDDEARAAAAAEKLGTEYQGLYVRDGT